MFFVYFDKCVFHVLHLFFNKLLQFRMHCWLRCLIVQLVSMENKTNDNLIFDSQTIFLEMSESFFRMMVIVSLNFFFFSGSYRFIESNPNLNLRQRPPRWSSGNTFVSGAVGLRLKSRTGQIRHRVARKRNVAETGPANSLYSEDNERFNFDLFGLC